MSKRFELPHIGVMEYSAEGETDFLQEYEKRGRITLNEANPSSYFSAMSPQPPEFNADMPEL